MTQMGEIDVVNRRFYYDKYSVTTLRPVLR
jgi:hypothetical protein